MPAAAKKSARKAPNEAARKVRDYIAALPPESRRQMKQLRAAIRAAAPAAVEHFGYGIPGFRLDGKVLVWYAAWKSHTSLYPMGDAIRRKLGAAIAGYESTKGTIRFPLDDPPSPALVTRIVKARAAELRARGLNSSR